jgi:hypothetical protein
MILLKINDIYKKKVMRIKLTESQIERIKNISEGQENKYNREIILNFNKGNNFDFKGMEVDWLEKTKIRLSFDIDIEARSWGIKGIMLYNITGPEEVEMEVVYYPNESDDSESGYFPVKLDWEKALVVSNEDSSGLITVGDEIEVYVEGSVESGFFASKIEVVAYTL